MRIIDAQFNSTSALGDEPAIAQRLIPECEMRFMGYLRYPLFEIRITYHVYDGGSRHYGAVTTTGRFLVEYAIKGKDEKSATEELLPLLEMTCHAAYKNLLGCFDNPAEGAFSKEKEYFPAHVLSVGYRAYAGSESMANEYSRSTETLSLLFNKADFSPRQISGIMAFLSDMYYEVSGDVLEIKNISTLTAVAAHKPVTI
jgi:hypothetical protein